MERFVDLDVVLPGADMRFGTREGTYAESARTVAELEELLGPMAHMKQVHGARVVGVKQAGLVEDCDGIVCDVPGVWLGVKTADCVPVLFAGPGVVGAVHAGWRGLEKKILAEAVRVFLDDFGVDVSALSAVVGPCISAPHYEVESHFEAIFGPEFVRPSDVLGKAFLDVRGVAEHQLCALGVGQVAHVGRCTFAEKEVFNSYRRFSLLGGEAYGVQVSCVRLRG